MVTLYTRRIDVLTLLLKAPDLLVNQTDARHQTALFYGAAVGWEEGLLLLLQSGANRDVTNIDGLCAAQVAGACGHLQAQALLQADPKKIMIHDACAQGRHQLVLALFRQGCPYNFKDERQGKEGLTPLMAASAHGQLDVVRILIRVPEVVKNINAVDFNGMTALHLAAAGGWTDVTFLLLASGSDRNIKDKAGLTAQGHAAQHGMTTLLTYLSQLVVA